MSATLQINHEGMWRTSAWMPSGAIFAATLECTATAIEDSEAELAHKFRDDAEFDYADFSGLSAKQIRLITGAVVDLCRNIVVKWHDFPDINGFKPVRLINELKGILLLDSRMGEQSFSTKEITFDGKKWKADDWIYNLVLENIIARLKDHDNYELGESLSQQWLAGEGVDFSKLSAEEFQTLFAAVDFMHVRYGDVQDGRGRDSVSVALFSALTPRIVELYNLFRADSRMQNATET